MLHSDGQGQALFDGVHLVDKPVSALLGLYSMLLGGLKKKRKMQKLSRALLLEAVAFMYWIWTLNDGWSMSSIG